VSTGWKLYRRRDTPALGRRVIAGVPIPPTMYVPPRSSLLVVGPTQVGKTTALVMPAILRWHGPVVVTSVKHDVLEVTGSWRSLLGANRVIDPASDIGMTWDPLEGVTSLRTGLALARDLVLTGKDRSSAESEFWNALAVKSLGAIMAAVVSREGTIFDVRSLIEARQYATLRDHELEPDVDAILATLALMEPRTQDAVCATMEAMLLPWQISQPLARVRDVLDGENTLYLCAPRTDHRHYEGLFRGALRTVLDEQERRAGEGRAPRLLIVLDEAASIAPLEDLDQIAATVSGLNVTLVTVFQDFAQVRARWADKAATVVNNHTTRIVFGGLVDSHVGELLPGVLEPAQKDRPVNVDYLRRLGRGYAIVISGGLPRMRVRVVPWFRDRRLRWRGQS
jgi:type IV secretion system protein VirD4